MMKSLQFVSTVVATCENCIGESKVEKWPVLKYRTKIHINVEIPKNIKIFTN